MRTPPSGSPKRENCKTPLFFVVFSFFSLLFLFLFFFFFSRILRYEGSKSKSAECQRDLLFPFLSFQSFTGLSPSEQLINSLAVSIETIGFHFWRFQTGEWQLEDTIPKRGFNKFRHHPQEHHAPGGRFRTRTRASRPQAPPPRPGPWIQIPGRSTASPGASKGSARPTPSSSRPRSLWPQRKIRAWRRPLGILPI